MPIEARNITLTYDGGQPVLRSVSACAEDGRITAVIGPNAGGKTTLLRVLAGVLVPQSGEVVLNGSRLCEYSRLELARRLAYVSQRPVVDAPFSVRDVVGLAVFSHGDRAGRDDMLTGFLERCALGHLVDTPFHQLSVGQQQRVSIARALVQLQGGNSGRVLLLDEPMSAMDPKHVELVGRLLRETAARGTAVVLVLHDLALAEALADDVWVIHQGSIAASGSVQSTLTETLLETVYGCRFQVSSVEPGNLQVRPLYQFNDD